MLYVNYMLIKLEKMTIKVKDKAIVDCQRIRDSNATAQ